MAGKIAPFVRKFLIFLRWTFYLGYIPYVIYMGITNEGFPVDQPISLTSVLLPFAAPQ